MKLDAGGMKESPGLLVEGQLENSSLGCSGCTGTHALARPRVPSL